MTTAFPATDSASSAFQQFRDALISGNPALASSVVKKCLADRVPVTSIYLDVICRAQSELGILWSRKEISITQEHIATEISLTQICWLRLQEAPRSPIGLKILVAAAPGDPHTFPARVVADLFYFEGWEVHFSGTQAPANDILHFADEHAFDAIALSVTLEPETSLQGFIRKLAQLPSKPKIVVGGSGARALDACKEIDLISADPRTAVIEARKLFGAAGMEAGFTQLRKDLGARISLLRREKAISQFDLASRADLDRAYLSALEHGKHNPTFNVLYKIASALGKSVKDLML